MSKNRLTNWDPEKKKQRDADREARDKQQEQQKALWLVRQAYEKLKKRLTRKRAGRSYEEVVNFLLDLRNNCIAYLNKAGLEAHKEFALKMIDDKLGLPKEVVTGQLNRIYQYLPQGVVGPGTDEIHGENLKKAVKTADFRTEDALHEVDFVKTVMQKEGFLCLLIQWPYLVGFFTDEEVIRIGILTNSVGVGKLPTWVEFRKAWLAHLGSKTPGKN